MNKSRYFIRGRSYGAEDTQLQAALESVHDAPERPRCMCVQGGVEMYVAKHREFVLKRMPGTGGRHHPTCQSFEPEAGTSGLGELIGEAIVEHELGKVEIRTDFPLARFGGKAPPRGGPGDGGLEPTAVSAPRKRMSLRAVLHFLYERAGFNRWYPGMEGKRTQNVIRNFLMEAARGVTLKGDMLDQRLYVPETFRVEKQEEIGARRREKLAMLMSPGADVQFKLGIVIGQFVDVEPTAYGRRITVKHMPDVPLYIENKAWEKAERAYGSILQARDADVERKPKVVMAALIYAKREHLYQVDTLTFMLVSEQWVPLNGLYELDLVERLQAERRVFWKPLKYDAKSAAGYPSVLLLDSEGGPKALHVVSPFMDPKEQAATRKSAEGEGNVVWLWETDKVMPLLPPPVADQRRQDGRGESAGTAQATGPVATVPNG